MNEKRDAVNRAVVILTLGHFTLCTLSRFFVASLCVALSVLWIFNSSLSWRELATSALVLALMAINAALDWKTLKVVQLWSNLALLVAAFAWAAALVSAGSFETQAFSTRVLPTLILITCTAAMWAVSKWSASVGSGDTRVYLATGLLLTAYEPYVVILHLPLSMLLAVLFSVLRGRQSGTSLRNTQVPLVPAILAIAATLLALG